MFGYTVPSYGRLQPLDMKRYRRYYCEGCHQLKRGFGLRGTATVNYDMTFNTILLDGIMGDALDFEGTSRKLCVLEEPHADSEMMAKMAAYTIILTKWELVDDDTDKPSLKTKAISSVLDSAIEKAVRMHPDYDELVGDAFGRLHQMELDGCKDARMMGLKFGEGLARPLGDIAGDHTSPELENLFKELTAAVYIMDAIDDLDDDFMDNTYNPFLPETGYVNARKYIDSNMYQLAGIVNETVGSLQSSYSAIRGSMKGNVSLCDNIVGYGIPESAKKVIAGEAQAKASVKNVLSNRKKRNSK